jgi:hypothetical protein
MDAGEVVATIIALAALGLGVWQGIVNARRFKRDDQRLERMGTADLIAESVDVNPDELQVRVLVRNKGVGPAYAPYVFLVESDGLRTVGTAGRVDALAMGQSEWLTAGLEIPADGPVQVWLGWEDVRGFQERDTGAHA